MPKRKSEEITSERYVTYEQFAKLEADVDVLAKQINEFALQVQARSQAVGERVQEEIFEQGRVSPDPETSEESFVQRLQREHSLYDQDLPAGDAHFSPERAFSLTR